MANEESGLDLARETLVLPETPTTSTNGSAHGPVDAGEPPARVHEFVAYMLAFLFVLFEAAVISLIVYIVLSLNSPVFSPFQSISIILVLGWVGLFTAYLAWGTYFYNFNFGRSAQFWSNFVTRVREARLEGKTENEIYDELSAPRQNPYADHSLGLPPGTIRGSLALTIIIGGIALLISFFGGDAFFTASNSEIIQDYFEFFKTAFLMVVAFYFGTKGLDILERERTRRARVNADARAREAESVPRELLELEQSSVGDGAATPVPAPPAVEASDRQTPDAAPTLTSRMASTRDALLEKHYPQVADIEVEEKVRRELTKTDLEKAALQLDLELALVQAVSEVEARGSGFLPSGRPKILFEGHIFWRQLKKYGIDPAPHATSHPSIIYPKWTRVHYRGGEAEHDRLNVARSIHERAALCSASWGRFQIMGFNHEACGFSQVETFVAAHEESEKEHLEAFLSFLRNTRSKSGATLLELLKTRNWVAFAEAYNGPGYEQNQYHTKLEQAYRRMLA